MINPITAHRLIIEVKHKKLGESLKNYESVMKDATYGVFHDRFYRRMRVIILRVEDAEAELLVIYDKNYEPSGIITLHCLSEWSKVVHGAPYNLKEITKFEGRLFTLKEKVDISLDVAKEEIIRTGLTLEELGIIIDENEEITCSDNVILETVKWLLNTRENNNEKDKAIKDIVKVIKNWI